MKTYVINLENAFARKQYMQKQLEELPFLSPEFVIAVDGRKMTKEGQNQKFNIEKFKKNYSREVRPGEIGCTLSHQKCYQKLMDSGEEYALILEDDIVLNDYYQDGILDRVYPLLCTNRPKIVLLSGWYWYLRSCKLFENYRIAKVYDAYLAHAYIINRSAAKLLIESRPFICADDWWYIRGKGVKLWALLPHVVDQIESEQYPTQINIEEVRHFGARITWKKIMRHLCHIVGKYESYNNI